MNQIEFEQDFMSIRKSNNNDPQNKAQALKLGHGFKPGEKGLLIKGNRNNNNGSKEDRYYAVADDNDDDETNNNNIVYINKGDAVAFYNYKNDGSGNLDWRALHTGLPTTEEDGSIKWIANHWFRLGYLCDT